MLTYRLGKVAYRFSEMPEGFCLEQLTENITLRKLFACLFWAVFSLCSKTSVRNGCSSLMRPSSRSGLTPQSPSATAPLINGSLFVLSFLFKFEIRLAGFPPQSLIVNHSSLIIHQSITYIRRVQSKNRRFLNRRFFVIPELF